MKRLIFIDFRAFKGYLMTLPEMYEKASEVTREQAAPYIKNYLMDKETETVVTSLNGMTLVCDHNLSCISRYFGDDGDSKIWTKQEVKNWLARINGPSLCNKEETLLMMFDFTPMFSIVAAKTIKQLLNVSSLLEGVGIND